MKMTLAKRIDKTARRLAFAAHLAASLAFAGCITFGLLLQFLPDPPFGNTRDFSLILTGAVLIPLMWFLGKQLKQQIFPSEGQALFVPSGRIASALKAAGIGLCLAICLHVLLRLVAYQSAFDSFIAKHLPEVLLSAAGLFAVIGACHPLEKEPRGRLWIFTGVICAPLILATLFSAFFFLHATFAEKSALCRDRVSCVAELGANFTNQILPKEATNISVEHRSGFISHHTIWTCTVSEADFLAFAKENGYELAENDSEFNANPETNHERYEQHGFLQLPENTLPTSFYFYSFRYRNHGGWTILYDRTQHILYGDYSSN